MFRPPPIRTDAPISSKNMELYLPERRISRRRNFFRLKIAPRANVKTVQTVNRLSSCCLTVCPSRIGIARLPNYLVSWAGGRFNPHFSHGKRREGPSAAGDSGSYSRSA